MMVRPVSSRVVHACDEDKGEKWNGWMDGWMDGGRAEKKGLGHLQVDYAANGAEGEGTRVHQHVHTIAVHEHGAVCLALAELQVVGE